MARRAPLLGQLPASSRVRCGRRSRRGSRQQRQHNPGRAAAELKAARIPHDMRLLVGGGWGPRFPPINFPREHSPPPALDITIFALCASSPSRGLSGPLGGLSFSAASRQKAYERAPNPSQAQHRLKSPQSGWDASPCSSNAPPALCRNRYEAALKPSLTTTTNRRIRLIRFHLVLRVFRDKPSRRAVAPMACPTSTGPIPPSAMLRPAPARDSKDARTIRKAIFICSHCAATPSFNSR